MANPYAPPAVAAFDVPPMQLPDGMTRFRLDFVAFRGLLRRRFALRVPLVFVIVALLLWFEGTMGMSNTFATMFLPIWAVLTLGISWLRAGALAKRAVAGYELIVSGRVARRLAMGFPAGEVLRPEVSRIVETRSVLWLLCDRPRRSLGLVRAIEGYAQLRAQLATWAPIEEKSGFGAFFALLGQARRQGPRDVIAGTGLEADPSLMEELRTVRAVSSDRGVGAGAVVVSRVVRTLLLWILLVVMFLVIWQLLQPSQKRPHRPRPSSSTTLP